MLQPFSDSGQREEDVDNQLGQNGDYYKLITTTTSLIDGEIVGYKQVGHRFANGQWIIDTYKNVDPSVAYTFEE